MHSFIAVAIVARSILLWPGAEASAGVEANNMLADAIFRGAPNLAAPDLPRAGQKPQTDREDAVLAAIVSARISDPDRVAGVLNELRVESTGHLGRLNLEEWSEMMAEMRSGGVALGNRNKLRLLVAAQSSRSHTGLTEGAVLSGGHIPQAAASPARALQEAEAESSSLSISGFVCTLPCHAAQ
jgi:hypothetical protein